MFTIIREGRLIRASFNGHEVDPRSPLRVKKEASYACGHAAPRYPVPVVRNSGANAHWWHLWYVLSYLERDYEDSFDD